MTQDAFDRFSDAPVSRLIGFKVAQGSQEDRELGRAVVELDVDVRFHNPMGRVHGGILSALADAATGIAFGRMLDQGQDFSTVDLQIQYMRPVKSRQLIAKAWVKQRGLRIGFVECEIRDNRDRLIASASCTCTTIEI
ncbi:MAG: PaaI family thioesterase [Pirellula sp.]